MTLYLLLRTLKQRDRFQQVLLRITRLATAGRWSEAMPGLVQRLQDELWHEIAANQELGLTESAVEALAELDPTDLARRALANKDLDNWAIESIVSAVPQSVRRQERLDELMEGEWHNYAGVNARGGATAAELDVIRSVLANPDALDGEDLRVAVIQAGAAKDRAAVPHLLKLLRPDLPSPELLENIIDSLGAIAGRDAVDALVNVVIGKPQLPEAAEQQAIAVLRHEGFNKKALDPASRDRLLRQLAILPPDDPKLKPILQALEGCPIREGAAIIEQIVLQRENSDYVRAAAVMALTGVLDRARLQRVIGTIASELAPVVADIRRFHV